MRKKTFVIFGLLIAALVFAVPFWAFKASGDPQTSERKVPEELLHAKELFQVNCGACHRLYAAGTDGNFGPDLDKKLAPSGPPQGENARRPQGRQDATRQPRPPPRPAPPSDRRHPRRQDPSPVATAEA